MTVWFSVPTRLPRKSLSRSPMGPNTSLVLVMTAIHSDGNSEVFLANTLCVCEWDTSPERNIKKGGIKDLDVKSPTESLKSQRNLLAGWLNESE